MIVGGGGWSEQAATDARAFAEASALPVACAFRCQDYLDSRSPSYVRPPHDAQRPCARRGACARPTCCWSSATGSATSRPRGYTLLEAPLPRQELIHVYPDAAELGRVFAPALALVSDSGAFFAAIEPVDGGRLGGLDRASTRSGTSPGRSRQAGPWQLDLATVVEPGRRTARRRGDPRRRRRQLQRLGQPLHAVSSLPQPADAGQRRDGLRRAGGGRGEAARARSGTVVAFVGDGGFQMSALELATAAQEGVAIVVIVVNNGMYGTIRMFQERRYPGRVVGTELRNPDFAALARACGAHGETVERTEQFLPALERALGGAARGATRPARRCRGDHAGRDDRPDPRWRAVGSERSGGRRGLPRCKHEQQVAAFDAGAAW